MDIEKSHESFERIYDTCWRYYRELEHSLAETRRYVAFDESNFSTFSLPSEITVVTLDETIKLLPCKGFGVEGEKNARGALRYNYADGKKKLPWWDGHTKLKHHRITLEDGRVGSDFVSANLGNALNSMAALYTLEKALLGAVGTVDDLEATIDDSELFAPRPRMAATSDIDSIFDSLE